MTPVSVLIATRDRHDDLSETLGLLVPFRGLVLELIVVDDGSTQPVEPLVRRFWPDATVVRHEQSRGQSQRRSEGFLLCKGTYILHLDDDSSPVDAGALIRAVGLLDTHPEAGLLAFHVFNGRDLPSGYSGTGALRYTISFVGCGALIRSEAVRQTGGYNPFFASEWEEEELSIRLMKAGWALLYDPSLVVHHRLSPRNRRSEMTWARGVRNKLWSIWLHFPAHRVVFDGTWVLAIAVYDAVRLLRFGVLFRSLREFAGRLPDILKQRVPMSATAMARYDALRFRGIATAEDFHNPPRISPGDIWRWFTGSWLNRARQRSFWDRHPGDIGASPTVGFAHQKPPCE